MFWDTVQPNENSLDFLLAKEDVNLYEILEEPTCLQEIKCDHDKLLDFLGKDEILLELLRSALALKFPDNGQPPTNGEADTRNGFLNKDQYKFAHLCTEALCLAFKKLHPKAMASKPFMGLLLNYLDEYRPQLNHLVVGFYVRLIVALLQAQPNEKWDELLVIYVNSDLIDHCVASLNYGAINDLFSNILVVSPDFQYRMAVKDWYTEKRLARQLVECFDANRPAEFQENAAYIWADFVKSLRDYQYSLETKDDPLLESLTEDHVMDLLAKVFGPDADTETAQRCEYIQSDSVLSNGASVLNALLESKYDRNAPSVVLAQANSLELSIPCRDSHDDSLPAYVPDAERVVEHAIARRSTRILELALECVQDPPSADRGDVFIQMMQLLGNLLNTNDLETHTELLKAFQQEGTSMRRFFDVVRANPMMTVYNVQLTTVVVHILFSNTGDQHPLLEHLINDVGLLTILREALPETMPEDLPLLKKIAHRSFFFNLADRVQFARQHAPMSDLIDLVVQSAPDYAEWAEFCDGVMREYADLNRSDSLSERPSNINGTFDVSVDEFDTAGSVLSGLNGIELKVSTPEKAAAFEAHRRSPQTISGIFSEFPPSPRDPAWSTDAAAQERSESPTAELFRDIFAAKRDSPRSTVSSTAATAGEGVDDWPGAPSALADDWPGASTKNVEQGMFAVDNDGFKPAAEFCFEDTNGHGTPSREIANALLNGVKKIHESSTTDSVPPTPPRGAPPTEDWPTTPKQQQDAFGNFSSPKVALKPDTAVSDDEEY